MSGHTEHWGVWPRTETVTVVICSRCCTPYGGTPMPVFLAKGDSLTVVFPCCPDDGSDYIEWDVSEDAPMSIIERVDA